MRRMFSLEQLKGIANSEVYKIIPQASGSDSGKVIEVGSNGKYKLATPVSGQHLYCHPINIVLEISSGNTIAVSLFVFNNSATALTWTTFLEWVEALCTQISIARIVTTGSMVFSGTRYPANYIYFDSGDNCTFFVDSGIELLSTITALKALTPSVFNDGVNQLI